MAELGSANSRSSTADIYTILLAIAMVALVIAVVYVWVRHSSMFGKQWFASLDMLTDTVALFGAAVV